MTSLERERSVPATTHTRTRALVVVVSVAAALAVWLISSLVLSSDVTVPDSPGSAERHALGTADVMLTATVAALAGWALLAVLERFTSRARAIWTAVAVAVFVVMLPYLPGYVAVERVVLVLLHTAVAVPLVVGLRRTSRQPSAARTAATTSSGCSTTSSQLNRSTRQPARTRAFPRRRSAR